MSFEKIPFSSNYRRAHVRIDLGALKHNALLVKKIAPKSSFMAVIKANAYGHGMLEVAESLLGIADDLAVASIDDALFLRNNLSQQEIGITILSGFHRAAELAIAIEKSISCIVYDQHQLDLLEKASSLVSGDQSLSVWIKVDTGMSRLGFTTDAFSEVVQRLELIKGVNIRGIVSHFANADIPENENNRKQHERFLALKQQYAHKNWQWSLANSAGLIGLNESHHDWVRPGIMLFGSSPLMNVSADSLGLLPVMTLASEIISVRIVLKGQSIGYGSIWTAERDTQIGVVACGYADGYPRHIAANTPVLIKGQDGKSQSSKILGRVSMDLLTVDLTGISAEIGSEVILWGKGLSIDEIAKSAETIGYELMCGITQRVRKKYINI